MQNKTTHAIILAAGLGSRLGDITKETPKCLLRVGEELIIDRLIRSLRSNQILKITVVVGYLGSMIEEHVSKNFEDIEIIYNDDYLDTNNMYSMLLGLERVSNGYSVISINADCIYGDKYFENLSSNQSSRAICVKTAFNDESMKAIVEDGFVRKLSKEIKVDDNPKICSDMYVYNYAIVEQLKASLKSYLHLNGKTKWLELGLDDAISQGLKMRYVEVDDLWYEVDTEEDLFNANKVFS